MYFAFCRFYRTVVVPTADKTKKVKVSVVKLKPENISLAQIEMLEQEFLCSGDKNGLLCSHTIYGVTVTLNVDHVRDLITLIPIPDGQYDTYEEVVTRFSSLDKLACNYNPPPRKSPADVVDMTTVLETLRKMDDVVSIVYNVPKSPTGGIQELVSALVATLQRVGYLSSLIEPPGIYSDLIQMAVQKFQTDYNTNCESAAPLLPSDGLLCPNTWKLLQSRLAKDGIGK